MQLAMILVNNISVDLILKYNLFKIFKALIDRFS